jgi:hypothetical protein
MRVLILFISLITIVSCNKEQELTLLDRCIEANMPELNETQREDIIEEILSSYEVVFPDETSKNQFKALLIADGWRFSTLDGLYIVNESYNRQINRIGISEEIEAFKNVYDYNIEYYGLSDGVDTKPYLKKTATRICNSQGIY